MSDTTDYEAQQIEEANASELTPVVFIHGLWLLPSSWDRWRPVFEEAGYATLAPGWPDDPSTVEDANKHPEVLAHKSVGQIADHFGDVTGKLTKKPALIGHSFGGLLTQILAGRGAAAVSVAIDPAPFRGVPYTVHLNDIASFDFPGFNPAAYEQQLIDEFDQLYTEGAARRRMMVIGLHERISGHGRLLGEGF